MVVVGLDKAAKTATVIGVFLTFLGLVIAVTALLLSVRKPLDLGSGVRMSANKATVEGRLGQVARGSRGGVDVSANESKAGSIDQRVER